jgi:CubicO group peptidase (beta-lactamase class C family)
MSHRTIPVWPVWPAWPACFALLALACSSPRPEPPPAATPAPAALAVLDPAYAEALEALAAQLDAERQTLHVPGLSLAIVKDDRLIFARGFGYADVEQQKPATPETLFAIGSTTKAFTATLVGMLADEHKLALDEPVAKTLPWFTPKIDAKSGEVLTYRDLLAHRTGFARMDMLWHTGVIGPGRCCARR